MSISGFLLGTFVTAIGCGGLLTALIFAYTLPH
jgi:hypothetical protein